MSEKVRVGVIGAGLMGKELAGARGRWSALQSSSVNPQLTAVCDVNAPALDWFRRVSSGYPLTDVAYFAERAGELGDVLGCATPAEALASHELFDAALLSSASRQSVPLTPGSRRRHTADDVAGMIGRA